MVSTVDRLFVDPAQRRAALGVLREFQASPLPGAWPHLTKRAIVHEMRRRLRNPFSVQQGIQPLCGPASILFELIRHDPVGYVRLCQSLYETGGFWSKSRWIETSAALREASQGQLHMGPADWMVLAALRESENFLFPVQPDGPELVRNLAGMTKSWEMQGWVREILGFEHSDYVHTYVFGDMGALQQAQQVLAQGGVAFALITADALLNPERTPRVTVPNHWIALSKGITVEKGRFGRHDSGRVQFDCFTWGSRRTVAEDEGPFEDGFWGVVLGY